LDVNGSRVTVQDASTGTVQTEFVTPKRMANDAVFSRDGARLGVVSRLDGSVTVWDLEPKPKLRLTHRPTGPTRPTPTSAVGAMMVNIPQEQMRQAEKMMFVAQVHCWFVDDNRLLITDPESATLWTLNNPPAVLTRLDLEQVSTPLGAGPALPAAPVGDTIP